MLSLLFFVSTAMANNGPCERALLDSWSKAVLMIRDQNLEDRRAKLDAQAEVLFQHAVETLTAQNAKFKIETHKDHQRLRLSPKGDSALAGILSTVAKRYPRWKFLFDPTELLRAGSSTFQSTPEKLYALSARNLANPRFDDDMLHELTHMKNGGRSFSRATEGTLSEYDFVVDPYVTEQGHDEPEAYLISAYKLSKDLREVLLTGDDETLNKFLVRFEHNVRTGLAVSLRNQLLIDAIRAGGEGTEREYMVQDGFFYVVAAEERPGRALYSVFKLGKAEVGVAIDLQAGFEEPLASLSVSSRNLARFFMVAGEITKTMLATRDRAKLESLRTEFFQMTLENLRVFHEGQTHYFSRNLK